MEKQVSQFMRDLSKPMSPVLHLHFLPVFLLVYQFQNSNIVWCCIR